MLVCFIYSYNQTYISQEAMENFVFPNEIKTKLMTIAVFIYYDEIIQVELKEILFKNH